MSKYGVISGLFFPVFVFSQKTGKYGPEITPYLHTFHAVNNFGTLSNYDMVGLFQFYRLVACVEKASMFSTSYHARREDSLHCDTMK